MSRYDDDIRRAEGDAFFDAWRSGLNPDRVDYERVRDSIYSGYTPREASSREVARLRRHDIEKREEAQREEERMWEFYHEEEATNE